MGCHPVGNRQEKERKMFSKNKPYILDLRLWSFWKKRKERERTCSSSSSTRGERFFLEEREKR
jgi:hypothetical protein